jgi:hypothetical protein
VILLRALPPPNRFKLRLGPLPCPDAAAKLCTTLERFRPTGQLTIFAGRQLAHRETINRCLTGLIPA